MKKFNNIIGVLTVIFAIMVSVTAKETLPSLSAYALSENVLWYRLMHLSAVIFFMLNIEKNKFNLYAGLAMALVLAFDMYHFPVIHDIATVSALLIAGYSLIIAYTGFMKSLMIFLSGVAVVIFCIGYFNSTFHHLLAEIIAMAALMNGKILENINYKQE